MISTIPQMLLGVAVLQTGGNNDALPQSTVTSMQPTYMDAYLFVFAECIQLQTCMPGGLPDIEFVFELWIYLAIIPRVFWVTSACIPLRMPGGLLTLIGLTL